jgi:hypothetical protein
MTRNQKISFIALGAFIISFLLPAIRTSDFLHLDIPGYVCALSTLGALFSAWDKDSLAILTTKPTEYFAVLCSGLINPLFLATFVLLRKKKTERLGKKLRIVILCVLPACWLYFWGEKVYPNVGYFLWTSAMVVALFSNSFSNQTVGLEPLPQEAV